MKVLWIFIDPDPALVEFPNEYGWMPATSTRTLNLAEKQIMIFFFFTAM